MKSQDLQIPKRYLDRLLKKHQWSFKNLIAGYYPLSLDEVEGYLISRDPVLWAERYLVEESGDPWRLFTYKKISARYRGNTIHQCGVGTGITREVVHLSLWMDLVWKVGGLITAPRNEDLDRVYNEMLFQLRNIAQFYEKVDWAQLREHPHRCIVYRDGHQRHFKAFGFQGAPFSDLKVGQATFLNAATPADPDIWESFFGACLPGCETRLYSVPNGNPNTVYAKLKEVATPAEKHLSKFPYQLDPLATPNPMSDESIELRANGPEFLKFRWAKSIMPEPHWSREVRNRHVAELGGCRTPLYEQQVLGLDGDTSGRVFPRELFEPLCGYYYEYVHVVLRADGDDVLLTIHELNPKRKGKLSKWRDKVTLIKNERHSQGIDWFELLSPWLPRTECRTFGGVDVGAGDEPTEIVINELRSSDRRWLTRISLRGLTACQPLLSIFCAIDRFVNPTQGWGLAAGSDFTTTLRQKADELHRFGARLSCFAMTDETDDRAIPDGRVVLDSGQPRMTSYRDLGTRLLEFGVRHRMLAYPADREVFDQFLLHKEIRRGYGQRRFCTENDGVIEAQRVAELRLFLAYPRLAWG